VTGKNIYSENVCAFDVNARSSTLIETSRKISTRLLTCFCQGNISSQSKQLSCEAVADLNLHSNAMLLNRCSAEPQGSEPQGSASGCQGFWQNRPNLPGTKLATTVQCSFNNTTVSNNLKMHTSIIAQGSMSNANICGRFCCSNEVEKHCSNVYCCTHVLLRGGGGWFVVCLVSNDVFNFLFLTHYFNTSISQNLWYKEITFTVSWMCASIVLQPLSSTEEWTCVSLPRWWNVEYVGRG